MKISIKIVLFGLLAATGLVQAHSSKAEKATIKFEQKYAQGIADYKDLDVKNQATNQIQQFFMVHKFYQVKTYKRLLKDYAKYQAAQDSQEKTFIDEFVETIKMMRPEILGTMLYQDFHAEFVTPFQAKGSVDLANYANAKQYISIFSQKTQILADFLEKYKPYLSASLIVQMNQLQDECGKIKADLARIYGFEFVHKYSSALYPKSRSKVVFALISDYIGACLYIAGIFMVCGIFTFNGPVFPIGFVLISIGIVVMVYSLKSLKHNFDVKLSYKDWLEFVV